MDGMKKLAVLQEEEAREFLNEFLVDAKKG